MSGGFDPITGKPGPGGPSTFGRTSTVRQPTAPGVPRAAAAAAEEQLKKGWWGRHGTKVGLAGVGLGLAALYGVGSAIQASVAQVRTQNRNWDRQ